MTQLKHEDVVVVRLHVYISFYLGHRFILHRLVGVPIAKTLIECRLITVEGSVHVVVILHWD